VRVSKLRWTALAVGLLLAGFQFGEGGHRHEHLEVDLVDHNAVRTEAEHPCGPVSHLEPASADHHRACPTCLAFGTRVAPASPAGVPRRAAPALARRRTLRAVACAARARRRACGRAPPRA
jgi:hypothetical protein